VLRWPAAAAVGVAMGGILAVGPALAWLDARDWREVPAVIEKSEGNPGGGPMSGGGPSWNLQYRYEIKDRTYYGADYSLLARGSLSGLESLSARYTPGSTTTAWVDPDAPDRAVLVRQVPLIRMIPAFGLMLVPVGAAAFFCIRWVKKSRIHASP